MRTATARRPALTHGYASTQLAAQGHAPASRGLWPLLRALWCPILGHATLTDVARRAANGTNVGATRTTIASNAYVSGPAYATNGSSTYISFPQALIPTYVVSTLPFSFVFVGSGDASGTSNQRVICCTESSSNVDVWQLVYNPSGAARRWTFTLRKANTEAEIANDAAVNNGQVVTMVGTVTWSADTPTMRLWQDGVEQSGDSGANFGAGDDQTLYIGRRNSSSNFAATTWGVFGIFDAALSATVAQELSTWPIGMLQRRPRVPATSSTPAVVQRQGQRLLTMLVGRA